MSTVTGRLPLPRNSKEGTVALGADKALFRSIDSAIEFRYAILTPRVTFSSTWAISNSAIWHSDVWIGQRDARS